jgi:hypothetical protein
VTWKPIFIVLVQLNLAPDGERHQTVWRKPIFVVLTHYDLPTDGQANQTVRRNPILVLLIQLDLPTDGKRHKFMRTKSIVLDAHRNFPLSEGRKGDGEEKGTQLILSPIKRPAPPFLPLASTSV